MPNHFPELPKVEWTKSATDAEYKRLRDWWDAEEERILIEMPQLKDDKLEDLKYMAAGLGFAVELDDILSASLMATR